MADNNSVEFTVRIKDEGLDKLAGNLGSVEQKVDSLGSSSASSRAASQQQQQQQPTASTSLNNKMETPENLNSSTNSLAALRQFCVKKEKTV